MFNVIAVLLSLAMMLTGATAPEGATIEPVGRVMTLSEVTLDVNGQTATLEPTASLGVGTDGASCVYDFHIDSNDERLLPFQLTADESGLMLVSENSNTTVSISAEEIDQAINQQLEGLGAQIEGADDANSMQAFLMQEFLPAYADIIKLATDPEAAKALQADGDRIFNEIVDRGEGTPGQAEYEGVTYEVTNYHYTLNGEQLGRLTDAMYASNDTLTRYAEAYFKLLAMAAEQDGASELAGIDSFEALFNAAGEIEMEVKESISEDGLDISDIVMTLQPPQMTTPAQFNIHTEKLGENSSGTINGAVTADGMCADVYMETYVHDGASRVMMTMGVNPVDEADEAEEAEAEPQDDAAAEPAEIVPGEETVDKEDIGIMESEDAEEDTDAAYFTLDCYSEPMEEGDTGYGFSCSADIAGSASLGFHLDGLRTADNLSENHINIYYNDGESDYSLSFRIDVSDDTVESHADAENAVAMADLKPEALLMSVTADALKLSANESVKDMMALLTPAEEAADEEEVDEADETDDAARSAEPYDDGVLSFGEPQFTWLPEGYALGEQELDTQYDMMSCQMVNDETGDSVLFFISSSFSDGDINYYTYADDGSITAVEGTLVSEENSDGYRRYSVDDGKVTVSVYPDSDAVSVEDICRILAGITY